MREFACFLDLDVWLMGIVCCSVFPGAWCAFIWFLGCPSFVWFLGVLVAVCLLICLWAASLLSLL